VIRANPCDVSMAFHDVTGTELAPSPLDTRLNVPGDCGPPTGVWSP
jgi:hypothetical protein